MYVRTHYRHFLDKLLTPTSVATTTSIMNWCSEATLVSSLMTRADSKLEVKRKQFVSERASARELNECMHVIWQAIVSTRLYLIVRTQNLLSILRCTPRSLKEPHWTQASLVDEVRIQPSMKTSKPKSSLRRPRFPIACTARQEYRDTVRSLLEPGEEDMSTIHDVT
jgi:hypothetical protein